MTLKDTTLAEAQGWASTADKYIGRNGEDPADAYAGYVEHELSVAIRAIADERRAERERGIRRNTRVGDDVQEAIKAALDLELYAYGLRVIRRANWRGPEFS